MEEYSIDSVPGDVCFEDVSAGESQEYGDYTVERDEIISFGKQYTPHPTHTDEKAAKDFVYGGLIASGIQTIAIASRLIAEHDEYALSTLGGWGIDELRWEQPVRPGDTLSLHREIIEKQPWNDNRGLVSMEVIVSNQNNEEVMDMKLTLMFIMENSS
ncbi:MaoC/PaaZ C-terminal domain-containing protein [Natrialba taiwanensis]|nr:MaoC/PaaZ C-terminal domain-containing protein [Natrialba taiwanensis]